jgi:hypothetical protein
MVCGAAAGPSVAAGECAHGGEVEEDSRERDPCGGEREPAGVEPVGEGEAAERGADGAAEVGGGAVEANAPQTIRGSRTRPGTVPVHGSSARAAPRVPSRTTARNAGFPVRSTRVPARKLPQTPPMPQTQRYGTALPTSATLCRTGSR